LTRWSKAPFRRKEINSIYLDVKIFALSAGNREDEIKFFAKYMTEPVIIHDSPHSNVSIIIIAIMCPTISIPMFLAPSKFGT